MTDQTATEKYNDLVDKYNRVIRSRRADIFSTSCWLVGAVSIFGMMAYCSVETARHEAQASKPVIHILKDDK